jgi:restriction system protein
MAVPDFQSIMLPLLKLSADQKEHTVKEIEDILANEFNLTKEDRVEMLPSGTSRTFANRIAWAKFYLQKAVLLESPRRTIFRITPRGLDVVKQNPSKINIAFLRQFEEYREFQKPTNGNDTNISITDTSESTETPRESLEGAYQFLRKQLVQEVLEKVKESTPMDFEKLVVELLVKMGYGGTVKDAGKATQYSNDAGVDGIIKEDKLGLNLIYIQAKRYKDIAVGRPDLQAFVGALHGKHATKGVFLTTSRFSENALEYKRSISDNVVLIDGEQLANFMIDCNLGVTTTDTFELKKIDNDYFGE